jgi:hypothetical protein
MFSSVLWRYTTVTVLCRLTPAGRLPANWQNRLGDVPVRHLLQFAIRVVPAAIRTAKTTILFIRTSSLFLLLVVCTAKPYGFLNCYHTVGFFHAGDNFKHISDLAYLHFIQNMEVGQTGTACRDLNALPGKLL